MKKNLLLAFVALSFASCQPSAKTTKTTLVDSNSTAAAAIPPVKVSTAEILFTNDIYNFGEIKKGEIVTYDFKFKNTGKEPLIIKDALATCGCTVPEIPKEPILPGAEGILKVVFNSAGKPAGPLRKQVTVSSNAVNSPVAIQLLGTIKE
ncbi:DUF1573 domain-containing protein [Pedobacter sp. JCM 36344]|uniref:DUF1573 domain-containing protein n=1 Tax=Pedobacter sp. JCM 36344 TaxID=3374280 RepID=UPI00397E0056